MVKLMKTLLSPQEQKQKEEAFMKDVMDAMMMSMMVVITAIYLLPRIISVLGVTAVQASSRSTHAQTLQEVFGYQGITDSRTLHVIGSLRWIDLIAGPPYTPWVHAFIINDGPAPIELGINHPDGRFLMGAGETRTVDRSGADEWITSLFYICPLGQVSTIRVTGEY